MTNEESVTYVLDLEAEPWRAEFTGLGSLTVDKTGDIDVELDVGKVDWTETMLRDQIGEPLSWWRRGYWLLDCAAVVSPKGQCVLVGGGLEARQVLLSAMAADGWRVLSDTLTPVQCRDRAVTVMPRSAPMLALPQMSKLFGLKVIRLARPGAVAVPVKTKRPKKPKVVTARMMVFNPLDKGESGEDPRAMWDDAKGVIALRMARSMIVAYKPKERSVQESFDLVHALAELPVHTAQMKDWMTVIKEAKPVASPKDRKDIAKQSARIEKRYLKEVRRVLRNLSDWLDSL